jgi:hypothetical protein
MAAHTHMEENQEEERDQSGETPVREDAPTSKIPHTSRARAATHESTEAAPTQNSPRISRSGGNRKDVWFVGACGKRERKKQGVYRQQVVRCLAAKAWLSDTAEAEPRSPHAASTCPVTSLIITRLRRAPVRLLRTASHASQPSRHTQAAHRVRAASRPYTGITFSANLSTKPLAL